jgi:iron complex outermembrane recepter protein
MKLRNRSVASFARGWRHAFPAFAFALSSLFSTPAQMAEPATSRSGQGAGAISGRVQNVATGQYLNNARVTVKGTDITTFTDEYGGYRLGNVPPGSVLLEVFYTGLDTQQIPLQVRAGQVIEQDVDLTNRSLYGAGTDIVRLDPFMASSSKLTEGEALATNEQRFAANIKNVVATDAFGDVTEGNVAEFMKFLPGITVEYSNVMPLAVAVRGFDAALTSVTMDGAQLAQASRNADTRQFDFTQVSINNTSRVEVTKVPTPANAADGISGTVNMVSKSAFERSRAQFNYRAFVSASSDGMTINRQPFPFDTMIYKVKPGFDFDYTLPISRNFGIVWTALHSKQWNEQNLSTKTYNAGGTNTGASPSRPYLQSYQIVDAPKWYNRDSTSLKADWRLTPNSVLSIGGQATYYEDMNGNNNRTANVGTNGAPTPASGVRMSFGEDFTHGATGRGSVTFNAGFLHIAARTLATNIRYRFEDSDWKIDTGASVSNSKTWRRFHEKGTFQALNSSMTGLRVNFDGVTAERPATIRVFDSANRELDINDLSNYIMTGATSNNYGDHKSGALTGDVNIKRKLKILNVPAGIQLGASYKELERDIRRWNRQWTYNPVNPSDRSPTPFRAQVYTNRPNYFGWDNIPWTSSTQAVVAWENNPDLFTQTPAQQVTQEQTRINGSEWFNEAVSAGYAQVEARFLQNRLLLLTGVRYEQTNGKGAGPLFEPSAVFERTASGAFARDAAGNRIRRPEAGAVGSMEELRLTRHERANRANRTYDGYYPSLHLTFNATEKLLFRAAYAKTYGRPDYNNVVPNATIAEEDIDEDTDPDAIPGRITIRNTGLKPWTAHNYDLSVEYYTDHGGFFSGGAFLKEITDFFGNRVIVATAADLVELGLQPQYVGWTLSTTINAGDARVSGVEFNARQSFAGLGGWGRYFTAFANGTKLKLEGNQQSSFRGFMPQSANWGVTFTKRPITVMAKWNHRGEQKRTAQPAMGPDAFQYDAPRTTLDMNVTYQLWRRLSLFANARNVTNVHFQLWRYGSETPYYAKRQRTDSYGTQYVFGVKGTF